MYFVSKYNLVYTVPAGALHHQATNRLDKTIKKKNQDGSSLLDGCQTRVNHYV